MLMRVVDAAAIVLVATTVTVKAAITLAAIEVYPAQNTCDER